MDKKTYHQHRRLRKYLKQATTCPESATVQAQLYSLASDWKGSETGDTRTTDVSVLLEVLPRIQHHPALYNQMTDLLIRVNDLLSGLNTLSLVSLEISDKLAVSSCALSAEERQHLEHKKVSINQTIHQATQVIHAEISAIMGRLTKAEQQVRSLSDRPSGQPPKKPE